MRRCVGVTAFRQQFPEKSIGERCEGRNCLNLVTIGHSISHDQVSSAERSAKPRRLGGDGRIQMNSKLTKLAAASVLSLCIAAPALAGSVTQPGETVGLNAGTPLAPGWYAINTVDWGCRNTTPQHTCAGLTIPVVAWSTPWTILGGRVQLLAAWPGVEVGVQRNLPFDPGTYFTGMYNPAALGQLAWDLGYGWGFSYAVGAYFDPARLIPSTRTGARPATWIVSSRARTRLTCRCRTRPSMNWSSTSRPPRRSASTCRPLCSPAPTR